MDSRFAKKEDIEEVKKIWKYCFNDPEGFFHYYFENKYKEENTLVIEEGEDILSSLQLNQYKIKLKDKIYDTSYVVGVSTLPEIRGKGAMKILMKSALKEMYERKQYISILMPIDDRLYRPYGYEHCYDQIEYTMDIKDLHPFKIKGAFKEASLHHIPHLLSIYDDFLKDKNGFVIRDKNYFENLFKEIKSENGFLYIHESEHGVDGYMIYFIMNETLIIRELFYKNIDALTSFLKFIYHHNTQLKKVIVSSPIEDKMKCVLPNLKTVERKIKPFMMGRVINFKEFMESLEGEDISVDFNLKIEDPFIEENNKIFHILGEKGKIKVKDTLEKEDIKVDINTLSQLVFSYIDVEEGIFLKKIKYEKEDTLHMLKKIFEKKLNYINEYV